MIPDGNTRFTYFHRDAHNYKEFGSATFKGEVTREEARRFKEALDLCGGFSPEAVGIMPIKEGELHEVLYGGIENSGLIPTTSEDTEPMDIHEFIRRLCSTAPSPTPSTPKSHWDVDPDYPVEDWKYEVENDDTRLGYHDWVENQKQWAIDDPQDAGDDEAIDYFSGPGM